MGLSYLTHFFDPTHMPSLAVMSFPLVRVLMMFLHCLIGLIAAMVAYRNGRNLGIWLLWGLLGGTLALITAITALKSPD